MAEKRFFNYQDVISSLDQGQAILGFVPAGRYYGFDEIDNQSGLSFTIEHSRPLVKTLANLTQESVGVIQTPQGQAIHFDSGTGTLSIQTNSSNAFERLDIVVYEHEWVNTVGGANGTFSVIKGADGGPVLPALPNPEKQIIVGIISVPASATDCLSCTYTPADEPDLGDIPSAKLDRINRYSKMQQLAQSSSGASSTVVGSKLGLNLSSRDGNTFIWASASGNLGYIEKMPKGTELNIVILSSLSPSPTTTISSTVPSTPEYTAGWRGIWIPSNQTVTVIQPFAILNVVLVDDGTSEGERWVVKNISDNHQRLNTLTSSVASNAASIAAVIANLTRVGFSVLSGNLTLISGWSLVTDDNAYSHDLEVIFDAINGRINVKGLVRRTSSPASLLVEIPWASVPTPFKNAGDSSHPNGPSHVYGIQRCFLHTVNPSKIGSAIDTWAGDVNLDPSLASPGYVWVKAVQGDPVQIGLIFELGALVTNGYTAVIDASFQIKHGGIYF